jgi:hypothetical protein
MVPATEKKVTNRRARSLTPVGQHPTRGGLRISYLDLQTTGGPRSVLKSNVTLAVALEHLHLHFAEL